MSLSEKGKICPICNKDIGVISIMLAGTPNRIKCKNCKTPIKYKNIFGFTVFAFAVSLALIGTLFYFIFKGFDNKSALEILSYLIPFSVIWHLLEFCVALYLRSYKILESNQKTNETKVNN